MATEDNLMPFENGQGLNHIDSPDAIPPPPPPPPPPPLMPPPPPPPMPPDTKGQPDDLLTFQGEDCTGPCLEPLTPEVQPPPPGIQVLPPSNPDSTSSVPEEEAVGVAEESGFTEPLPPVFVPPPVGDTEPETPSAMEVPDPETEDLPQQEPPQEPLPPVDMDNVSSDNVEQSPQGDVDVSSPHHVDTSYPYFEPPSSEAGKEVPEPEQPPDEAEISPAEVEPPQPLTDPIAPGFDFSAKEEEEIEAPNWSDEPEPVVDYPPPGMTRLPPDTYPEPAVADARVEAADTYPAEAETPEAPPAPVDWSPPEPEPSGGGVEAEAFTAGPQDVPPVQLSAMAAAPAQREGSPDRGTVPPPVGDPPVTYDMNTSPHPPAPMERTDIVEPPREDLVHLPPATTYVVPPDGYDVIDEEQGRMTVVEVTEEKEGGGGETCCARCVRCLSHVPCGSLISWIMLVLGLGALAGSLLVAARKTRALLQDDSLLWFMELTVTGVAVAMFVLGTCFLVVAHLSSEPTCRRLFNSSGKNSCARGLNIFLLVFVYVLCVGWVLVSAVLTTPVVMLVMMFFVTSTLQPGSCLQLHNYGFPARDVCFPELHAFEDDAQEVLICYGVTLLSSIIVVISLVHFLICLSANITHLRDNRFTALSTYEAEDEHNSKHAMLDTNM
ncbi:uncharacterized protein LOC143298545 [Babylonia areolata]|uniref:uncharacterized protein LOC143298545 n=1 Tax=Babylonia areolata TaxID=304850 RepID=UPI003FCFC672